MFALSKINVRYDASESVRVRVREGDLNVRKVDAGKRRLGSTGTVEKYIEEYEFT